MPQPAAFEPDSVRIGDKILLEEEDEVQSVTLMVFLPRMNMDGPITLF
jgi:hypothetical protein